MTRLDEGTDNESRNWRLSVLDETEMKRHVLHLDHMAKCPTRIPTHVCRWYRGAIRRHRTYISTSPQTLKGKFVTFIGRLQPATVWLPWLSSAKSPEEPGFKRLPSIASSNSFPRSVSGALITYEMQREGEGRTIRKSFHQMELSKVRRKQKAAHFI